MGKEINKGIHHYRDLRVPTAKQQEKVVQDPRKVGQEVRGQTRLKLLGTELKNPIQIQDTHTMSWCRARMHVHKVRRRWYIQ